MYWNRGLDEENLALLEHIDTLFSYAVILTGNRAKAEDLVHETYVSILNSPSCPKVYSSLRSWMLIMLRDLWLNQLQKEQSAANPAEKEKEFTENIMEEASSGLESFHEKGLGSGHVGKAIQRLPLVLREVIFLREYGGLSYPEIAGALNCTVAMAMSRSREARSELRRLLSARMRPPGGPIMKTGSDSHLNSV